MEVRAHPTRGFEMLPNTVHYTYREEVRVNALGLRGPDHLDAGDDDARVVVLGDSLVFGQGVGEEATLPRAVERSLEARRDGDRRRVRVWNGGVRSYNTEQELALLEELLPRIRPDVVVLAWFPNDLDRVDVAAMSKRLEASGPIVFDWNAPATAELRRSWRLRQIVRSSALVMKLHDVLVDLRWPEALASDLEAAWRRNDDALDRLARLAREHDFDVLVAAVPLARHVADDASLDATTPRLAAACEARGLAALDLLPVLRAQRRTDGRLNVLAYDGHYDGAANAAMGEEIAEELEQRFPRRFAR
jgi:lysophospholipase L1-like esterase